MNGIAADPFGVREISYLVASLGGISLLVAVAIWWKILSEGTFQSSAAKRAIGLKRLDVATIAISLAFALSGAAASIAAVGWFLR